MVTEMSALVATLAPSGLLSLINPDWGRHRSFYPSFLPVIVDVGGRETIAAG